MTIGGRRLVKDASSFCYGDITLFHPYFNNYVMIILSYFTYSNGLVYLTGSGSLLEGIIFYPS